jgi:hypothetical protein
MLKKIAPEAEFIAHTNPPKEWQAEAFLSAILFCCYGRISVKGYPEYRDWDFMRICWLINTYGNVFDFPFAASCRKKVQMSNINEFINNLRLTPTDAKRALFEICRKLLSINSTGTEERIYEVLVQELVE